MSELQERLTHLVNYSSQLIFVSGDSIAKQQRALEEFLSSQQENTEVSYFSAQADMQASDYRRMICQQLLAQKVGSYVRPLSELMQPLQEQAGLYLVCIKQAQNMPNEFLQELWDWVIQSRKSAPYQHLNLILFGETQWAEDAKRWLPQKNSDRPVLLSTESVAAGNFDLDALESLMANKGKGIGSLRFTRDPNAPSVVTRPWFIGLLLSMFLLVFVGMLSWQYPAHVSHFLATGELPSLLEQKPASHPDTGENTTETSNELETAYQPELEVVTEAPFNANDILIKNWQKSEDEQQNKQDATTEDSTSTLPAGDFAVPDILDVSQLDAQLGEKLSYENDLPKASLPAQLPAPAASTAVPQAAQIANEQLATEQASPAPVTQAPSANQQYRYDEAALLAQSPNTIVLQLAGIQNRQVLESYLGDNNLQDLTWVYETTRYGGPWYVVLYKQAYADIGTARQAALKLAPEFQSVEPFAKRLSQIQQEIAQQ